MAAAAQGIFLSLVLALKDSKTQTILASLIFLFSVCLFYYTGYWANILYKLPRLFGLATGLTYLFGPLLYFYIKSGKKTIYYSPKHFIPFAVYTVYFILQAYFIYPRWRWLDSTQTLAQNGHLIFYIFLIYNHIQKAKEQPAKLQLWRTQLLIAYSGYALSFLIYYILVWMGWLKVEYDYIISLAAAVFIYFVGYRGFANPEMLGEYDRYRYEKSSLSDYAAKSILKKIKEYFEKEKAYRNSELRLGEVATQTGLSTHQISQVLNEFAGVTFSDFVNRYRLQEAKSLLANNADLKIIEVAFDCGFNNKTSFNNVFKRHEGMSPSAFRKANNQSLAGLQR